MTCDISQLLNLSSIEPYDLFTFIVLYAETHYRFRFFPFSLYFRRQPEIIFDVPLRIEPGHALPVTLIVKDAHKYPLTIEKVLLTARSLNGASDTVSIELSLAESVTSPFWYKIFYLDIPSLQSGHILLDASAVVNIRNRRQTVHQDNHIGLSHAPFVIYKAADPLPSLPDWYAGELHCHTDYGIDYVEFGAPLPAYHAAAKAMGLSWVALTDHSYNLDDLPDNYLKQDPNLTKWKLLQEEARRLSRDSDVILIPGEELSCRSSEGRNVHMLILGDPTFYHGSGDGAEKWFRTRSEWSVQEVLDRVDSKAFVAAGHPFVKIPFLERLLVHRGEWQADDLQHPRLDGWQILNGVWDEFSRQHNDLSFPRRSLSDNVEFDGFQAKRTPPRAEKSSTYSADEGVRLAALPIVGLTRRRESPHWWTGAISPLNKGKQTVDPRFSESGQDEFTTGYHTWISALERGVQRFIYAGNDAHGNFNRFRQVKLPIVKLWEHNDHLFGKCTARVKIEGTLAEGAILSALKAGQAVISDGPMVEVSTSLHSKHASRHSERSEESKRTITVHYKSSPEFGKVTELRVFSLLNGQDRPIYNRPGGRNPYEGELVLPIAPDPYYHRESAGTGGGGIYVRAELTTETDDGKIHKAMTNAVWI